MKAGTSDNIGIIVAITATFIVCGAAASAAMINNSANTTAPTTTTTTKTPRNGDYEETEIVDINYKSTTVNDDNLEIGTTKTKVVGKKGSNRITYKVTYKDDKEVKREKIKEEVVTKPVNEVIAKGTKNVWHCVDVTSFDRNPNNDNKCTSSKGEVRYVNDATSCKLDKDYRPGQSGPARYNTRCNY